MIPTRSELASRLARRALPLAMLAGLAACAPTFEARVARFSALPPPETKSFVIEPGDPTKAGGLEFATYANLVRKEMLGHGFVEAASPAQAKLTVQLDYNVGPPREEIRSRPGVGGPWGPGFGPGFGGPGWYGGWRGGWGWNPYWGGAGWGGGWGGGWNQPEVYSVTRFNSQLAMKMYRNADKASLFEGRAETVSSSNNLTQLVPNLVRAIFTQFPGNSGETIRVTFNPTRPDQPATVRPAN